MVRVGGKSDDRIQRSGLWWWVVVGGWEAIGRHGVKCWGKARGVVDVHRVKVRLSFWTLCGVGVSMSGVVTGSVATYLDELIARAHIRDQNCRRYHRRTTTTAAAAAVRSCLDDHVCGRARRHLDVHAGRVSVLRVAVFEERLRERLARPGDPAEEVGVAPQHVLAHLVYV